jgi:hypothetical protein
VARPLAGGVVVRGREDRFANRPSKTIGTRQ